MGKLVEQFGYHACAEALNRIGARPATSPKRAGRPVEFDYGKCMELWLYVEEGCARLGLSVQAFCKHKKAEFVWFTGGLPQDHSEYKRPFSKIIKGDTLRRRYNEAVAFLKSDTDLRARRSTAQDAFPGAQDHSLEKVWNEELRQRLMNAAA